MRGTPNPTWFGVKSKYNYVLRLCTSKLKNRKFYIGRTHALIKRIKEHQNGNVWTTRRMLPIKLIFCEGFLNKNDAIRRERYLKTIKGKSTLRLMLRESLK